MVWLLRGFDIDSFFTSSESIQLLIARGEAFMNVAQETLEVGEGPTEKPARDRRVLKILSVCAGIIVLIVVAAQIRYTYSGSGQWEFVGEKHGVTVYQKKVPGEVLKQFEAVFTVKSTLNRMVAFMQDTNSDLNVDFSEARTLEQDKASTVLVTTWRSGFSWPFKDRDFVVREVFSQDPATGTVVYTLHALPNRLPPRSCCVRIPKMDNTWLLTPLKNGLIRVQWSTDMSAGGFMPYFMLNAAMPSLMYSFGSHLHTFVNRKKYWDARFSWIREPTT